MQKAHWYVLWREGRRLQCCQAEFILCYDSKCLLSQLFLYGKESKINLQPVFTIIMIKLLFSVLIISPGLNPASWFAFSMMNVWIPLLWCLVYGRTCNDIRRVRQSFLFLIFIKVIRLHFEHLAPLQPAIRKWFSVLIGSCFCVLWLLSKWSCTKLTLMNVMASRQFDRSIL